MEGREEGRRVREGSGGEESDSRLVEGEGGRTIIGEREGDARDAFEDDDEATG